LFSTYYANREHLIRYNPSGKYYARIRVRGKLIVRSMKTGPPQFCQAPVAFYPPVQVQYIGNTNGSKHR
jgi:hypothetical protein